MSLDVQRQRVYMDSLYIFIKGWRFGHVYIDLIDQLSESRTRSSLEESNELVNIKVVTTIM